mgnify:CR=1 FL=1
MISRSGSKELVRGSLLALPALPSGGEFAESLVRTAGCRMERIISRGDVSPPGFWYDQDEDEWAALLQGSASLELEDGRKEILGAGDWIFLPARIRHRVAFTSAEPPCIWIAVFSKPGPG